MSSTKFKPGDRVRWFDNNDTGQVTEVGSQGVRVLWADEESNDVWYGSNEVDRYVVLLPDNPVSPNHYRFPGGAEVIQISEHLTSNGGQAVQYVARATRLDGQIKGNAIEDLEKAAFFIQREIDRLKESK